MPLFSRILYICRLFKFCENVFTSRFKLLMIPVDDTQEDVLSQNQENKSHLHTFSHVTSVNIKWLPIVFTIILVIMVIINYSMYQREEGEWPTISRTASVFPMNRIFAVCMSVSAFLMFFYCSTIVDHLELHNFPHAKYIKIVSLICSIFFIAMGNCGMNDQLTAHNVFAGIGFVALLVFPVLVTYGHYKVGILRFKIAKIIIAVASFVCLIPLVSLTGSKKSSPGAHAQTVIEFITLFLLFVLFLLNIVEFNEVKIEFRFGEGEFATEESEITKNLVS